MDAVSYSLASKQAQRIEKFIENPDSTSGIVTVPKTIASGETITIPAGRVAVLPNLVVDGTLNIDGEVFIPSGSTYGDLDAQIALKADTSYVNTQLWLKQNVLVANDSGVKTALNASGEAPIYACRAWVNFNGTGTVAIRASGNVSSITDNGIGLYSGNLINGLIDSNAATVGGAAATLAATPENGTPNILPVVMVSATQFKIGTSATNGNMDAPYISVSIFR